MALTQIIKDYPVLLEILKPTKNDPRLDVRLQERYKKQATFYDNFRERMLHGRIELLNDLIPQNFSGTWIDIGGGTGWNIEKTYSKLSSSAKVIIVDLCEPLLNVANKRFAKDNTHFQFKTIKADATNFNLDLSADIITFSYSLSMIPNWFSAIDNGIKHLKENGKIGVVDFFAPTKYQNFQIKNNFLYNQLIPWWFSHDDVFINKDLLPYLESKTQYHSAEINLGKIPYLPVKVPYVKFIGTKEML
jgi:S-adenosylmethionine-diacylgycerolhomoserine-N-methlytransferase